MWEGADRTEAGEVGVGLEEVGSLPGLPSGDIITAQRSSEVLPVMLSLQVSSISIIK